MNGVPLVFYTMAVIREYILNHKDSKIIVAINTDSQALSDLIREHELFPIIYVDRKSELAGDMVAKVDVIRDTYLTINNPDIDVVIDLDITSPLRSLQDVENIIDEYLDGRYDLVCSVVEARRSPYFNMIEDKKDGYYRKICSSDYTARQQAPRSYELNASIYAYNPVFLKDKIEDTILDHRCGISVMPDYLVLDIDSEKDFEMMQFLHSYYCRNDAGINAVYEMAKRMMI